MRCRVQLWNQRQFESEKECRKNHKDLPAVYENVPGCHLFCGECESLRFSEQYANKKIEKLNSLLQKEFGDQYIDVSSVLLQKKIVTKNGKGTKDNLHYKAKTNRAIYKQVKKFVNDYAYPEGE